MGAPEQSMPNMLEVAIKVYLIYSCIFKQLLVSVVLNSAVRRLTT